MVCSATRASVILMLHIILAEPGSSRNRQFAPNSSSRFGYFVAKVGCCATRDGWQGDWILILEPPDKVQKLQAALQAKAKGSPGYRFYLLYDKLYRKDVLEYAYRCCKANRGSPGVDSQDLDRKS